MKYTIQKLVISSFSVALAAFVVSPIAEAAEATESANLHQVRIAEFDSRNKGLNVSEDYHLHQVRTAEMDRRNKVGDKLSTTSLIEQRQRVLDRPSN